MPSKRTSRIYWRHGRAWADFRDYAFVGGGREPLVPDGAKYATPKADVAARLVAERLNELQALRLNQELSGECFQPSLGWFAQHHLDLKADEGTSAGHLDNVRVYLKVAVDYFGAERDLRSIRPRDVRTWLDSLRKRQGRSGKPISNATRRKYLNALSDLYARAVSDEFTDKNPARDLYSQSKPKPERRKARYWEPDEVAALLEAARTMRYEPTVGKGRGGVGEVRADAYPWIYPLLATAALTGARKSELFGLEVDDISFRYGFVFVRPNEWRDLKTLGSDRRIPLWPQLEKILLDYIAQRETEGGIGALLFPSHRHAEERILDNIDRQLDKLGERAGIAKPRLHAFRHSYTAARLQTLEHGAPVSIWQVASELGHQSTAMIEKRYGHLATVRDRKAVVEFLPNLNEQPEQVRV